MTFNGTGSNVVKKIDPLNVEKGVSCTQSSVKNGSHTR